METFGLVCIIVVTPDIKTNIGVRNLQDIIFHLLFEASYDLRTTLSAILIVVITRQCLAQSQQTLNVKIIPSYNVFLGVTQILLKMDGFINPRSCSVFGLAIFSFLWA